MKREDPMAGTAGVSPDEIGGLLRAGRPLVAVPAGLDVRIQAALGRRRVVRRSFAPLVWAAAVGLVLVAGVFHGLRRVPEARVVGRPVVEPVPVVVAMENPLRREAQALARDADRTGRFLIDALPSFDFAGRQ
jgi:hypothetical protein